jgi:hypothetical protein
MSFLNNYWKETSCRVKKIGLVLRGLVTALTTNAYVQGDLKMAFYVLLAGAVLDILLQFLPPDSPATANSESCAISGTGSAIAVIALLMLFTGACSIIKPGVDIIKTDSTYTTYKQVDLKLAGATVTKAVDLDSLFHASLMARDQRNADAIASMKYKQDSFSALEANKLLPAKPLYIQTKPIVQYFTDPQTKAQLSYWVDQYGKLQLGCESKDQVVHSLQTEVNKLSSQTTTKTVVVTKTPNWNWMVMGAEGILLLICIVILIIKTIL